MMATFEEVYGMTLDEHIEQLKREGKWTDCHEYGHDIDSPDNLVCRRGGEDFEPAVKEIREEWEESDD